MKRQDSVYIEEIVKLKAAEVAKKESRSKMSILSRWLVKGMEAEGIRIEEGKCKK